MVLLYRFLGRLGQVKTERRDYGVMENLVLITFISAGVSALISYAAIRLHLEILEIKISNLLEEQDKDFKNQLDEVNKIVYEVLKNKK